MAQKKCPLMSKPGESLAKPSIAKTKEFCKECALVEEEWYIENILKDIEIAKSIILANSESKADWLSWHEQYNQQPDISDKKELDDQEKCYLFLLLYGMDTENISKRFYLANVTPTLSRTIYRYVSVIIGKKITNWAQVRLYLEKKKYRFALIPDSLDRTPVHPNLKVPGIKNKEEVEQILSQLINALSKE
jgi:hypothetical protein